MNWRIQSVPYYLRQNHSTRTPKTFVVLDTETQGNAPKYPDWLSRETLVYGYAEYHRQKKATDGVNNAYDIKGFEFTNTDEWWVWLRNEIKPVNKIIPIFAHNWNFDLSILNLQQGLGILGGVVTRYINGKPPLIIDVKANAYTYRFIDTLNFFPMSLRALAQAMVVGQKGFFSKDMQSTELHEYCKEDVRLLGKSLHRWFEFIVKNDLGNFGWTTPSQAFNAYRHRFMVNPTPIRTDKEYVTTAERKSYHGGRVECFRIGKQNEILYMLDVNSLYPHAMTTTEYPTRYYAYAKGDIAQKTWEQDRDKVGIVRATVDTDIPCLPVHHDGRLVWPVGKFTGYWCRNEFELAIDKINDYRVDVAITYDWSKPFDKYVDYFWQLRQEYEQDGNNAGSVLAKLFLNSLYGKFGQRNYEWQGTEHSSLPDGTEGFDDDGDGTPPRYWRVILGLKQYRNFGGEARNSVPSIASYITAQARCILQKYMDKAGNDTVYYCDTDSLLVNECGYNRLRSDISSNKLGALKLEWCDDAVTIIAPKHYTTSKLTKRKGIRHDAELVGKNKYRQIQFTSAGTHFKRGEHGFVDIIAIEKLVANTYHKGVVDSDGMVQPIRLALPLQQ